jgi:galactokinase
MRHKYCLARVGDGDLVLREGADPGAGAAPPSVSVSSEAPNASGLSTSTALILALFDGYVAAIPTAPPVSRDVLIEWAYEFEFAICNGGGMDQLAIALGGTHVVPGSPDRFTRSSRPH